VFECEASCGKAVVIVVEFAHEACLECVEKRCKEAIVDGIERR
jgi:hypothetical protein